MTDNDVRQIITALQGIQSELGMIKSNLYSLSPLGSTASNIERIAKVLEKAGAVVVWPIVPDQS